MTEADQNDAPVDLAPEPPDEGTPDTATETAPPATPASKSPPVEQKAAAPPVPGPEDSQYVPQPLCLTCGNHPDCTKLTLFREVLGPDAVIESCGLFIPLTPATTPAKE